MLWCCSWCVALGVAGASGGGGGAAAGDGCCVVSAAGAAVGGAAARNPYFHSFNQKPQQVYDIYEASIFFESMEHHYVNDEHGNYEVLYFQRTFHIIYENYEFHSFFHKNFQKS